MNSAIWADYTESYIVMLKALADVCDYVARHPSDADFSQILAEAHGQGMLQDDALANMGMVNRSTANRWLNGKARPSKLQQCVILQKFAAHLRSVAKEIRTEARCA